MADSMWGLDYDGVKKFAKEVQTDADKIESIAKALGTKVQSLPWKGPDAMFFKNNWDSTYEKNLKTIAKALESVAQRADKQAEQQKETSS